jgi:hypothetical protein
MTGLWRTWLTLWCWGVGVFGLVLVGAAFPATDGVARFLVDQMNGTGAPVLLENPLRFGLGLQGALTIGLAMLVYAAARAATELGPRGRPIWNLIVGALLAWYLIDSAISCATGFPLNALSNTLLMILFLVPIIASGVRGPGQVAA